MANSEPLVNLIDFSGCTRSISSTSRSTMMRKRISAFQTARCCDRRLERRGVSPLLYELKQSDNTIDATVDSSSAQE